MNRMNDLPSVIKNYAENSREKTQVLYKTNKVFRIVIFICILVGIAIIYPKMHNFLSTKCLKVTTGNNTYYSGETFRQKRRRNKRRVREEQTI